MNAPTFGSLFAGIGGIDLGLERAGWSCRWQVEYDPFCLAVLSKHWPQVPKFGDVTKLTGKELSNVNLVCGGFPCQPVSTAGKQRGDSDERWLWPEFARILRVVRPRFVLVENVPALVTFSREMGQVLGDLAAMGYDAEWGCLQAAWFGAPHRRERIFIIAHTNDLGRQQARAPPSDQGDQTSDSTETEQGRRNEQPLRGGNITNSHIDEDGCDPEQRPILRREQDAPGSNAGGDAANPHGFGEERFFTEQIQRSEDFSRFQDLRSPQDYFNRPDIPKPLIRRGHDGFSRRLDDLRLAALGNAVIPQAAEWLARRIIEMITPPISTVQEP